MKWVKYDREDKDAANTAKLACLIIGIIFTFIGLISMSNSLGWAFVAVGGLCLFISIVWCICTTKCCKRWRNGDSSSV